MDEPKKTTEKTVPNELGVKSYMYLIVLAVVFIVLIFVGIYVKHHQQKKPLPLKLGSSGPSLTLSSASSNLTEGNTVSISVWEDSGDQNVNAVQANISYPTDKFDFISSDSSNSSFDVQAQATGDNGFITLARGSKTKLTGRQLIAVISLKIKSRSGSANLQFTQGSQLISAVTNKDILNQDTGENFTIGTN